jgi:predicted dehydrogenase
VHSIIQVGCGRIFRERIVPAINVLAQERLLTVSHVVDVMPPDAVAQALDELRSARPRYHRIGEGPGNLAQLLQRPELRAQPVLVATPTPRHPEHACAALVAGCPVALEKPLAANVNGLREIESCLARHDERLLFPLGYYLIEKGLPLLALARRGALSPTQLGCLRGIAPEDWNELRSRLGAVSSVTAMLREGADLREWVWSDDSGGLTLETFSHLVAMVLPWLDELTLDEAVIGRTPLAPTGRTENVVFAAFHGPNQEPVRLACEKWCPDHLLSRWLRVDFQHGSAMMDLEGETLTVQVGDRQWNARVSARIKYEAQLRMFVAKLDDLDEPTELAIGRRSVHLSSLVREHALRSGTRLLSSSWLDNRLGRGPL